jgi:F1F0 ATPase subunit 2
MRLDLLQTLVPFAAGAGIGIFYFGGLWLTVRLLPVVRQPALLTLGSFFIRMGLSLGAFYFVMGGDWVRLLICVAGFFLVRVIMVRRIGPERVSVASRAEEV